MSEATEQPVEQPVAVIRPGLLDRLKSQSGITSDDAFARAIGVSRATLAKVKAGEEPSLRTAIGIAATFGLALGEVLEVVRPEPASDRLLERAAS